MQFPQTAPFVDLGRYAGRWFEISAIPQPFQAGCTDTQANYTPQEDGTIQVVNRCVVWGPSGPPAEKMAEGVAVPLDDTGAVLSVDFGYGVPGYYLILLVDPDYQWALVGSPDRGSLWILSRCTWLDPRIFDMLVAYAWGQGYPVDRLCRTIRMPGYM